MQFRAIKMKNDRHQHNGFILYVISWMLLLITALIVGGSLLLQKERTFFLTLKQQLIDEIELESNVEILKFLLHNPQKPIDWNIHGEYFEADLIEKPITLKIQPEEGKLDINYADGKLLQSFFEFALQNQELANVLSAQILDWRDADEFMTIEGAERNEYLVQNKINLPTNKHFEDVDEIRYILSMNDEIFQEIRPWITIYSQNSTIDITLASQYMLSMLEYHNQKQRIANDAILQELQRRANTDYNRSKYLKDGSFLTLSSIINQEKGKPLMLDILAQNTGIMNQKLPIIEWNYH